MPADRETTARRAVLGIDTCGRGVHVAVAGGSGVHAASRAARKGENVDLTTLVRGVLESAEIAAADLGLLAVTTGPGSFTGVRVGLAFVRGIGLPGRLAVVGVGSLDLLALAAPESAGELLCPLLDAGQGKVYLAGYRRQGSELETIVAPCLVARGELAEVLAETLATATVVRSEDEGPIDVAQPQVSAPANRAKVLVSFAAACSGVPAEQVLPTYVGAVHAVPNARAVRFNNASE